MDEFITWCEDNFLQLNVSKTKKIVFDFCLNTPPSPVSVIHNKEVKILPAFKYRL